MAACADAIVRITFLSGQGEFAMRGTSKNNDVPAGEASFAQAKLAQKRELALAGTYLESMHTAATPGIYTSQ